MTALTSIATSLSRIAAVALALLATPTGAAELVMFEDAGCAWCARFNAEVAPIYPKTDEGKRAPLRRVDSGGALPADLAFITPERLTPNRPYSRLSRRRSLLGPAWRPDDQTRRRAKVWW